MSPINISQEFKIRAGIIGGAILIVIGLWVGIRSFLYESTDDAFIEAHVVPMSFRVSGRVSQVFVSDNQMVAEDAPVVELDAGDYQAAYDRAQAAVTMTEADLEKAQRDVKRYKNLEVGAEVSRQKLDNAEIDVKHAEGGLQQAQAAAKEAELRLSYTHLLAPFSGRIVRKSVEIGQDIQMGQPLMSLVSTQTWVLANFKETELTHMHPGQPATIKVDAYPGKHFHGHVDSIQAGTGSRFSLFPAENATGNFVKVVQRVPVKIIIDSNVDQNIFLSPGMSVIATVKVR